MKALNIFAVATALVILASCGKSSSTTLLSGETAQGVETVYVVGEGIDTILVAENGRFSLTLPTCLTKLSSIECGDVHLDFIADGTPLTASFDTKRVLSQKKNSAQMRMNALTDRIMDFNKEYFARANAIYSDESLSEEDRQGKIEEYFDSTMTALKDGFKESIKKNKDSYVSTFAFLQLAMISEGDDEIRDYISLLPEHSLEDAQVKEVLAALSQREGTSEGCMFTDFAINSVVGFEKDGSRIVKPVCLSDYVGQGKYILVDFWASWCGPCKGEIPNIIDVYENFAGDRFDVLSIAVWDKPEDSFAAAEQEGICWKQIVCTEEDRSIPTDVYGIEGIPQIILFGPDGSIVARNLRGEAIAQKVAEVLGL